MSTIPVTQAYALPSGRGEAPRWLRRAALIVLLALHRSRRRMARRVLRDHRHLLDHACRIGVDWSDLT
jgi:hypothetical protein